MVSRCMGKEGGVLLHRIHVNDKAVGGNHRLTMEGKRDTD